MGELNLGALAFRDDGGVVRLGNWAPFLVDLGAEVARQALRGERIRVAVALPTRAYAAAFAALGAGQEVRAARPSRSQAEHFAMLVNLPAGARVRRVVGNKLEPRTVHGVSTDRSEPHLVLRGGPAREFLPARACLDIELMEEGADFTRSRKLMSNMSFVSAVFPSVQLRKFAGSTVVDAVIVGPVAKLRREIVETELLAVSEATNKVGCLNDLLRCDAFEKNANDHDRTLVVSSTSDDRPPEGAPVVIFDDSVGFLRKRAQCVESAWLLLLDRRSASATPAADAFNSALARSRGSAQLHLKTPVPPGIELAGFV